MSRFSNSKFEGGRTRGQRPSGRTWEWSLRPGVGVLFLVPVLALAVVMSWQAFRMGRSIYYLDGLSIPDALKALRYDPNNADLLHHLGSLYSTDPTEANPSEAVKALDRAVQLNPRRWDYWMDLGVACDYTADTSCSDHAYERVAALDPMAPVIMWSVGNHYLLTDRPEHAFPAFRRLIHLDSQYLISIYRLCFRATHDPQAIYTGLAANSSSPSVRFSFLQFLCSVADYESAMKIWAEMIQGPDPAPDVALVKPFLDMLMDHNQIDNAAKVWSDLQHAALIGPDPSPQAKNILYNSGFDNPPLNTGFGWNVSSSPDLDFDLSDPTRYEGGKCVRIEFPVGRDAEYYLLSQVVRVQPNRKYEFSAYVRSDSLTSQSGPRLREDELGCATCQPRTSDATVGSTPWHRIDLSFITQPQTQAVKVSFWRPQEEHFSRDITGTIWVANINLHAVGPPIPLMPQERRR